MTDEIKAEVVDTATGEITERNLAPVHDDLPAPLDMDPEILRKQFDSFLDMRRYMLDRIGDLMLLGADYHEIKGRRVLGKPGAEKLAAIYKLRATFTLDHDTMAALNLEGKGIVYRCDLRVSGQGPIVGQGRGVRLLGADRGDANKSVKMAMKSAHIDAVIRTTGVSDLFTQDMDDEQPDSGGQAQAAERRAAPAPPLAAGGESASRTESGPPAAPAASGLKPPRRRTPQPAGDAGPAPVEDEPKPTPIAKLTELTTLIPEQPDADKWRPWILDHDDNPNLTLALSFLQGLRDTTEQNREAWRARWWEIADLEKQEGMSYSVIYVRLKGLVDRMETARKAKAKNGGAK